MAIIKRCFICDSIDIKYEVPNARCNFETYCETCKTVIIKNMKMKQKWLTDNYSDILKGRNNFSVLYQNLNYIINNVREIK